MKKIYIIVVVFINFYSINSASCQQTIHLLSSYVNNSPLKNVAKIDIVNNIPDSNILGYIPSLNMNDRELLKPKNTFTSWLQGFANELFVPGSKAYSLKILWVIDDLSMGTDSNQNQVTSYLKLKTDIYSGTNDYYQMINTFDSAWIIPGDADFGQMTVDALLALYQHSVPENEGTSNARFLQMSQKIEGTLDQIKSKIKESKQIPVLENAVHPTGVYITFGEFANNAPSITNFYADVDSVTKKVQLYQIEADSSSVLIPRAWGISINNELYYYDDGQLYPIEKSGNTFYLAKYLEPRTRKNQGFYWRKIIGARQGDTNPYNDAHELKKNVSTSKGVSLEATHLDFDKKDFVY